MEWRKILGYLTVLNLESKAFGFLSKRVLTASDRTHLSLGVFAQLMQLQVVLQTMRDAKH